MDYVKNSMVISFEATFKKCYWDKNYVHEFVNIYANRFKKEGELLNHLVMVIGIRMTEKRLEKMMKNGINST